MPTSSTVAGLHRWLLEPVDVIDYLSTGQKRKHRGFSAGNQGKEIVGNSSDLN